MIELTKKGKKREIKLISRQKLSRIAEKSEKNQSIESVPRRRVLQFDCHEPLLSIRYIRVYKPAV